MPAVKNKLRLYLDTSVILSLLKNEEKDGVKLGENVANLLHQAADGKYQILVSEHTAGELLKVGVPQEYINQVLKPMLLLGNSDLLVINSDILNAASKTMRTYEIPFMDSLHIAFAQRNNALVVTRDISFTVKARQMVGLMTPEDLVKF